MLPSCFRRYSYTVNLTILVSTEITWNKGFRRRNLTWAVKVVSDWRNHSWNFMAQIPSGFSSESDLRKPHFSSCGSSARSKTRQQDDSRRKKPRIQVILPRFYRSISRKCDIISSNSDVSIRLHFIVQVIIVVFVVHKLFWRHKCAN